MKFIPSLLAVFFITITSLTFGQSININTAKTVAHNHLLAVGKTQLKSASLNRPKAQFSSLSVTSESKDTLFFVLNDTINQSFVIVAADKRSSPIIGYSLEGNYDVNNQPPAFAAWMESRKQEITFIKQNNLSADSKISEQWDNLSSTNSAATEAATFVEPLLKTKWDQGCYYNSMCPSDLTFNNCGRVPTGCVATSMAQIMKYWNYPTSGTGSHSYLSAGYGILSADFGSTTYQWGQMPNELTSENDAVATLMYHCGVALDMRYDPTGSGTFDPRDELVKYFNYSPFAEYVDKRSYLPADWVNLLKSELNEGRPIWYNGANSPCGGGHAFVCDGYRDSDYFHFNWGWGGAFDGYFYLGSLNPGAESFTVFQAAIIKIFPKSLPDGYKGILLSTKTVGIGINGGTAKVDIRSSAEWTASSDQTWLTLKPTSGSIESTAIEFTATANPTSDIRKARVTITASGFEPQTILVTQYSRIEVTAGNLKSILGSQLSTTTSLVLKGIIDARDFRTMRNEMPALTDIDLSETTIASYTGTEGTIGEQIFTYPANAVPNFAFLFPQSNRAKSRLQSIVLPSSVVSINDYAFQGCQNLQIESIPSSVVSIGNGAFLECNSAKPIVIPSSVTFIGNAAFKGFKGEIIVDKNNPNYSTIDGVLFNKTQTRLIQCPVSKTGEYTISSSVISIGNIAFLGCSDLTTISIPSSVTSIEGFAFNYCTGLPSITIPSSVTSIGQKVFDGFKGSIMVDAGNQNYSAFEGVLFNKNQTELIQCPVSKAGTYTIPSTVTTVQPDAFHACVNISSLIIPGSVKNIGAMSFNLIGLSSVYAYSIPPVDLNSSPFTFAEVNTNNCILYIPYGTKALYGAANQWQKFRNMVEMPGFFVSDKTVDIAMKGGTALVNIASNVSWTMTSDQTWLTINTTAGTAGNSEITFSAPANPTISSRKATVTVSATGYGSQTIEVTQYASVEATPGNLKTILGSQLSTMASLTLTGTIDARDFKTMRDGMPALTQINLSDVVIAAYSGTEGTMNRNFNFYPSNTIPNYAFSNPNTGRGKSISHSIILPSSVTSIGTNAFYECTGLNTIIPSSVTSIEPYAFHHCMGLDTIYIPSSVISIGENAFGYIKGLINVDANNLNYSSIDGVLFNKEQTQLIQCPVSKTGSYSIPSSVKTLNNYAFFFCQDLTTITIPSTVTSIGTNTFLYCYALTSINIPPSIKILPQNSFAYCRKLNSISVPSSVISISHYAFLGCDGLSSIYVSSMSPVDLTHSISVFDSVNKKTCTLYVPSGSKGHYVFANQWKDFTNIVEINPPVANAGTDQSINENSLFTLDGSASFSPGNDTLTYFWTAPEGITLSSNNAAKPSFTAPEVPTDTDLVFSLTVFDGKMYSKEDRIIISIKNMDRAPYVINPINNIIVDSTTPYQIIELQTIFADDDLSDVLSYTVTSNTNNQVVKTEISGCYLKLSFSSPTTEMSEIEITANSNGKEVSSKFNVVVKIPTGINSFDSDQHLMVFPNPTNGKIKVKLGHYPPIGSELIVTDIKGNTIVKKIIHEKEEWVDLTGNKPGMYLFKTTFNNTNVQKVILE